MVTKPKGRVHDCKADYTFEHLGFASQLIGDIDFAMQIDDIFVDGVTYKKLGIRLHEGPRVNEKVLGNIAVELAETMKARKAAREEARNKHQVFTNP